MRARSHRTSSFLNAPHGGLSEIWSIVVDEKVRVFPRAFVFEGL
jgi:hypothetical protein